MRLLCIVCMVGCAIVATAGQAVAAGFSGGLVIQQQTFDPAHPNAPPGYKTTYAANGVITYAIQHGWAENSDNICSQLEAALSKPDGAGKGFTLYNITCNMGDASQAVFDAYGTASGIHIDFTIPQNYLKFTSTQPTKLGSYADPTFEARYDLRIDMDIVPGPGASLQAGHATAVVQNVALDSQGPVADVVLPFVQSALAHQSPSYDITPQVNQNLSIPNALLNGQAQQYNDVTLTLNLAQKSIQNVQPASVLIRLQPRSFQVSLHGSGTIRGTIRWPVADGMPGAECSGFVVVANVINGYAPSGSGLSPGAPQQQVGSTPAFGLARNGNTYSCQYELSNLPYNVPLIVTASPTTWVGNPASGYVNVSPDGWSGQITILPPFTVSQGALSGGVTHIIQLNPQPLPPGRANPQLIQRIFVTKSVGTPGQGTARIVPMSLPTSPPPGVRATATLPPSPVQAGRFVSHSGLAGAVTATSSPRPNPLLFTPVRYIQTTVQNPTGRNLVQGIDFVAQFQVLQ
jgi:hypothetical protein